MDEEKSDRDNEKAIWGYDHPTATTTPHPLCTTIGRECRHCRLHGGHRHSATAYIAKQRYEHVRPLVHIHLQDYIGRTRELNPVSINSLMMSYNISERQAGILVQQNYTNYDMQYIEYPSTIPVPDPDIPWLAPLLVRT